MSRQGGSVKEKLKSYKRTSGLFHRNAFSFDCSNYYICSVTFSDCLYSGQWSTVSETVTVFIYLYF